LETRFTYGAAVATLRMVGSVVTVAYVGPLTPTTLAAVRRDTRAYAEANGGRSVVADARRAIIAVSWEAMAPVEPPILKHVPTAIVVPPGSLEAFQRHAWAMAQRGYLRGIFTDVSAALAWAKAKAVLGPRGDFPTPTARSSRAVAAEAARLESGLAP
jgi:hypothetical protein